MKNTTNQPEANNASSDRFATAAIHFSLKRSTRKISNYEVITRKWSDQFFYNFRVKLKKLREGGQAGSNQEKRIFENRLSLFEN